MTKVAIIGAGFSGTLLALHLLRRCPPTTEILLIEKHRQFGLGAAYGSSNPSHLLNVPAGKMSAFHDQPHHFLEWLGNHRGDLATGQPPTAGTFVPRKTFGSYVRDLLKLELSRPENHNRFQLIRGEAQAIEQDGSTCRLILDRDRFVEIDMAVLAIGNFPPEMPARGSAGFLESGCYRPDPWAQDTWSDLDPDLPVLLIGTGLTMIDSAISLFDQGHRGPIHALSRRGLVPRRHAGPSTVVPDMAATLPTGLRALTRQVRREAEANLRAGGTWHAVIDELRPFTVDLWRSLGEADRARFLRHLRPWWDVHRHRIAPAVAERIEAAEASGRLVIHAGWISEMACGPIGAQVRFRRRGTGEQAEIAAARVVNCSGPSCDYARISHPLVRQMLASGLIRPDPFRLGLDITPNCALRRADGAISRQIFAVGPVTRAAFWEMTAVPDIRRQCELLAAHIATLVKPASAARPPASPRLQGSKLVRQEFAWSI